MHAPPLFVKLFEFYGASNGKIECWKLQSFQSKDGTGKTEMRICVLGGDGYCGWATALYLSNRGHSVSIVDNFLRRQWDHELGAQTLTPIRPLSERLKVWHELTGKTIDLFVGDVTDYDFLSSTVKAVEP